MKNLLKKILGPSLSVSNSPTAEPIEESTIQKDQRYTLASDIPHYDLCQLVRNIEDFKSRDNGKPQIRSMRPALVKKPLEDDTEMLRVAERFNRADKEEVKPPVKPAKGNTRYDVLEPIGEGGTAIVYRALDLNIGREIAFKRFHPDIDLHGETGNFNKEIETVTRVDHPNVVVTHDVGKDADGLFIVMNLVKGKDLERILESRCLELSEFKEFAIQSLEGLMAVHAEDVLHLDLKPSNIMVSSHVSGRMHVQLIDFGSAKVMAAGGRTKKEKKNDLKGSIYFMSPEQINNDSLDVRTDIYSMGCVFYQALAGAPPFQGESAIQVMAAHLQNRFVPLHEQVEGVSMELSNLVSRMISSKLEQRPADVKEVIDELLKLTF